MTDHLFDLVMREIAIIRAASEFLVSLNLKNGSTVIGQVARLQNSCAKVSVFKQVVTAKKVSFVPSLCEPLAFIDIEQIAAVTAVNTDGVAA